MQSAAKLNILYYIPNVHQEMGGIRQYAIALLKILATDNENQYFVYHENDDREVVEILTKNPHLQLVKSESNNRYLEKIQRKIQVFYCRFFDHPIKNGLFNKLCQKHKINIIHCPYQYLPVAEHIPSICTMHDVQELHFPEYFTAEDRAHRAVNYLKYIRNASGIIVSYEHIKQDLLKYFNVTQNKVHVCFLNMSNLWLDKYSETDILPLTQLPVPRQYLLCPANTWAHKNHLGILEALVLLRKKGILISVVFTGHKTSYFDTVLKPYITEHDLNEQVIFLGIIEELTLYSLYKHCRGVVVATLYEAGSFPLMESLLLSIPVICSNVTSLPETIGEPEFIFNAKNSAEIAAKMHQLYIDEDFRERNLANGREQAEKLRNSKALDKIKAAYESLN